MADIILPDSLHCHPSDDAGRYHRSAEILLREDRLTAEALNGLRDDHHLPLDILREPLAALPQPVDPTLAALLATVSERRTKAVPQIVAAFQQRLPAMLTAIWIESGRTSREHQPRFRAYTEVIDAEMHRQDLYLSYTYDAATDWLNLVAVGMSPNAASADFIETRMSGICRRNNPEAIDESRIRAAWGSIVQRWTDMFGGSRRIDGQDIIVLHEGFLPTDHNTQTAIARLPVGATADIDGIAWTVQRLPAVIGNLIDDQRGPRLDRVLTHVQRRMFGAEDCALLLRNLLIATGLADYVDTVQTNDPYPPADRDVDWQRRADPPARRLGPWGPDDESVLAAVSATLTHQQLPQGASHMPAAPTRHPR